MSQKKVDAYKKEKQNRKANAEKERAKRIGGKILFWVILAAVVGVFAFFAVKGIVDAVKTKQAEDDVFKPSGYVVPDYSDLETEPETESESEKASEEAIEEETDDEPEGEEEDGENEEAPAEESDEE